MLNIDKRKIGFSIRLARERKNISREELADRMNVSKNYIYKIEAGKAGFTLDLMYKISRALGIELREIYEWEGSTNDVTKIKDSEITWRERELTEAGTLKYLIEKMESLLEKHGIEVPKQTGQASDETIILELIAKLPPELQKKIQQQILDHAWKKLNSN